MDDKFEFNVNGKDVSAPGNSLLVAVRGHFGKRRVPAKTVVVYDGIGYSVGRNPSGIISVRKMSADDAIEKSKPRRRRSSKSKSKSKSSKSSKSKSTSSAYYKKKRALADQITPAALAHSLTLADLRMLKKVARGAK